MEPMGIVQSSHTGADQRKRSKYFDKLGLNMSTYINMALN